MKKLLLSIPLLLTFVLAFGQPKVIRSSAANTIYDYRLGALYNFIPPAFADTTAANVRIGIDSCGAIIFTYNVMSLWTRACSPKRWVQVGRSITYESSNTIEFSGTGEQANPLTAQLKISDVSGNAIQIFADGAYVASSIEEGLAGGGIITWVSGYTYEVSPANFNIGGVPYSAPFTTVTLDNADGTFDRIDVVVASNDGTISVITGTPAADPQQPSIDVTTQVSLGFILVTANTIEPVIPPTQDWIYENYITNSWTTVSSTPTIVVNSAVNPYSVPLDVEGTLVPNNGNVRFTAVAPPTISNFNILTFKIRSKAVWASDSRIGLQWVNASAQTTGVEIPLSSGTFGFVSSQIVSYQIVSINLAQFGALVNPTNLLMTVRTSAGRTIGFYIDDIQLQSGEIPVSGNFYAQGGNNFGTTGVLGLTSADHLTLITNNLERARIMSSGHILVNKTTWLGNGQLEVNGAIQATSLRMAAYILSESGTTVTATTSGYNLTNTYGTNGTAVHTFVNGGMSITRSASQFGGTIGSYVQTSAGMGAFGIGHQLANPQYIATVGTVNGYWIGTLAYNTVGDAALPSGVLYGVSLNFNNQTAANNPNSFWFHDYVNPTASVLMLMKKTGQLNVPRYGVGSFTTGTPVYTLAVTSTGQIIEVAGGGGVYTASNGLTMTANNTEWGGALTNNATTTITGDANEKIVFSGASSSGTWVKVNVNTGATAFEGVNTSTGNGVQGVAGAGTAVNGIATTGTALWGSVDDGIALQLQRNSATTNAVIRLADIKAMTSGTAANGFGGSFDFYTESASNFQRLSNQIIWKWSDATDATRTSQFIVTGVNSAVTADLFTLSGSGALRLNKYGIGTFTGTPAYNIQVDASGNLIESAVTGGGMTNPMTTEGDIIISDDGSGTPKRLAAGTAGYVLTSNGAGTEPSYQIVTGTGTVTNTTWTGGIVSIANPTTVPAFTVAGTSGGGVYFSSTTAWASTALLAANAIMIGGGAGAAYSTTTTGTGVITALGINVGSAGAFVTFNGALGTPSSGTLTNATGLPIAGLTGAGTGVLTALAVNIGSAGAFVTFNGALGTPSSGTISTGVTLGDVTMNVTGTDATGDIYYRSAGGLLTRLAIGTSGQILRVSVGGLPEYFTASGTGTVTSVATTQPASGFTVTGGPITTSGTLVFTLNNDLLAVENLATTGIIRRTALNTWTAGTLVSLTTEITGTLAVLNGGTGNTTYTNGQLLIGNTTGNTLTKATLTAGNGIAITNSPGAITIATSFNTTFQTLTDGATINWNVSNGIGAVVTLAGTGRTLVIQNPVAGQTYTIKVIQGSGGNKTITTWPAGTAWTNGVPVLSTTAGVWDIIVLLYDGVNFSGTYESGFVLTYYDGLRKRKIIPIYGDEENYQIAA